MKFDFQHKSVIILLKSFVLGGAEKQALFLANYLQNELNCKVAIYSHIPHIESEMFYKECEKYGLTSLHKVQNPLSASGRFKYLKRRIKIALFGWSLRKHSPDIIIPYLNPPSIIASLCYKISGAKKTFWHHRGPDYYRSDQLERKAVNSCSLFIANSPNGKKDLIRELKLKTKLVEFVPNYTTLDKEELPKLKHIDALNSLPQDHTVIGMVAHFREQKHQDLVVKAFAEVLKSHSKLHLVLAGNIYESEQELSSIHIVKEIIEKEKISDKVTIVHNKLGYDIYPYLDIGMLISKEEGMPNVIMEYMAYGLPVIATKHEGCVALLGEDHEYFVENNVEDIVHKMNRILEEKALQKEMGQKNQEKLFGNFTIQNYIETLQELL